MPANATPTSPEPVRDELEEEAVKIVAQAIAKGRVCSVLPAIPCDDYCACKMDAENAILAYLQAAGIVEVPVIGKSEGSGE